MPYIKQLARDGLDDVILDVVETLSIETAEDGTQTKCDFDVGELNYVISSVVWKLFDLKKKYKTANDLMGVLECVKAEFYRRQVSPYEDEKINENGDL